jgi:cyclopropane fatty-acyl-phospholipid synthase-like methyltransferase
MTNKNLSKLLAKDVPENISNIDRYKIIYRPYITPFVDLLNLIPTESKIFDIGCGNGALLNLIYQTKNPQKIGGVEISKKLVDNANELLSKVVSRKLEFDQKVHIRQYDGINLENLEEYDYILLVDVIHHIPKQHLKNFFALLEQRMRRNATLILKDIDAGKSILVQFNKLHDLIVSGEIGNEISIEKAKENLLQAGFDIKSVTYKRMLWYPHYTIIATVQ